VEATEAAAVACGFAYVLLAIRRHRACWIAGGLSTAIYVFVFHDAGLPMQAALQVAYVAMAVYGWVSWRTAPGESLRLRSWPATRHGAAVAGVALATAISAPLLSRYAAAAAPVADSLGTWASLVATWLLARRVVDAWIWWIVVDLGLAGLFASQGIALTAALYVAFAMLAVAGWRSWRVAAVPDGVRAVGAELGLSAPAVTELDGGAASRTFRLRDARQDLVVRVDGGEGVALGANRDAEFAMQRLAASAGLAPDILFADASRGVIASRHVAGRLLEHADLQDVAVLAQVGRWAARLHALEPPAGLPAIDFGERAAGYLSLVAAREPRGPAAELAVELARRRAVLAPPARLAACHHDLHHRNLLDTGNALLAVDWEYAGPGDVAADLASCIGYHGLDGERIDALLSGYGDVSPALRVRVADLAWIFDCLWFGWNAAAACRGLPVDFALQDRLAARLAR
jgi:nicotinamide mononucleotide transporter